MSFNLFGAIAGAVAGYFLGPNAGLGVYAAIAGGTLAGGFSGELIGLLAPPLPEPPAALKEGGQAYSVSFQNNVAKLGDVQPVAFGNFTIWFPQIMAFVYYREHEQYYCFYGTVTVDPAEMLALRISNNPLQNYPGSKWQICLPAEPLTLFHSNVFTSPDVEGIELKGGAKATVSLTLAVEFFAATGRIETTGNDASLAAFIPGSILGTGAPLGEFDISGTVSNNGSGFPVLSSGLIADGDSFRSYVTVDAVLTDEVAAAAVFSYTQNPDDAQTLRVDELSLEFTADPDWIQAADDDALADFGVGDIVTATSGTNAGTEFEVLGGDGSRTLYVTPTPVPESLSDATLILVQRRSIAAVAAPKGDKASDIEVDIIFAGLGRQEPGEVWLWPAMFLLQWREVDDYDNPLSAWSYEAFTLIADSFDARRFSQKKHFDTPMRPQVICTRLSIETGAQNVRSAATLAGLKGYLTARAGETPDVDPYTTRIGIIARASGLLSRAQRQSLNGDFVRCLPVYDADEETWSEPVPTRNRYWAELWWLLNQSRGRIVEGMLDLPAFAARAEAADTAEDHFDAVFDRPVLFKEGVSSILAGDRAGLGLDPQTGQLAPWRDEAGEPELLFVDGLRGVTLGDPRMITPTSGDPTGTAVLFVDPLTWKERDVDDSPLVGNAERVDELSLFGCTEWDAAWRYAEYRDRARRYRTTSVTMQTEMEGLLVSRYKRVMVASARLGWGHGGQVLEAAGSVLMVTPAPRWTDDVQHWIRLRNPEGGSGAQIDVERGDSDDELILGSAPDVELIFDGSEGSQFVFGHDGAEGIRADRPRLCIVQRGTPSDFIHSSVQLLVEDSRVLEDPGTPPPDPAAPTGSPLALTMGDVSAMRDALFLYVEWDAVAGAVAYLVEQYLYNTIDDEPVDWSFFYFGAGTSFALQRKPGLEPQQVRVRALDGSTTGPWKTVIVTASFLATEGTDVLTTEDPDRDRLTLE